jgi:hypothetical protein
VVHRSDQRSGRRNEGFFLSLQAELTEAVSVYVRYETRDEKGKTRRERNDEFEVSSPHLIVPPVGRYLWEWYIELSGRLQRVHDGVVRPIPPSEYMAWREASATIVYPSEYAILCAMDDAYVIEMGKELADYRARQDEASRRANPQLGRLGYKG